MFAQYFKVIVKIVTQICNQYKIYLSINIFYVIVKKEILHFGDYNSHPYLRHWVVA